MLRTNAPEEIGSRMALPYCSATRRETISFDSLLKDLTEKFGAMSICRPNLLNRRSQNE